ncbi:hypothetical protein ABT369_19470 [Dactylosporangium sp. NPDC000244]|uniref:hypothetical protein n=1 Tax=Dactylosporangium sp. NPDC000244 TaxID=3154365 RepID=UPI003332A9E9
MGIMGGIYVVSAAMGLGLLCVGCYILATGKIPGDRVTGPAQVRRLGVAYVLLSGFFLTQVVGYLGVRLDLWSPRVRSLLILAAFALAAIAAVKINPLRSLTTFRRRPADGSTDHRR